jgi:hypothetical protein
MRRPQSAFPVVAAPTILWPILEKRSCVVEPTGSARRLRRRMSRQRETRNSVARRRETRSTTAETKLAATERLQPTRTSPAAGSERNSMLLTVWRRSSNTAVPPSSKMRPYWVASTPRGPRSSRRTPRARSNSPIDLEMADCPVLRSTAALLMLPACTTAIRTWRSCSFSRRPMRSLNSIGAPMTGL